MRSVWGVWSTAQTSELFEKDARFHWHHEGQTVAVASLSARKCLCCNVNPGHFYAAFFFHIGRRQTRGFGVSPFKGLAVHLVEVGEVHVHFLSLWCCPHGRPSSRSETRGGAVLHFDHLTETFQLMKERLNNFTLRLHKQAVRWLFTDNYSCCCCWCCWSEGQRTVVNHMT